MLTQALIFLGVAVVAVPIFQRLGLGTVLGYLAAGVAVGPSVLGLVDDPKTTLAIGEFGVVFMLFVIGLELEPKRLWDMRASVFGVGSVQVFATAALILPIGIGAAGLPLSEAVMVALCLALSSTALGLKLLNDRNERATPHGRAAFGILLFQDIAAIPIIAFAPLLGTTTEGSPELDAPLITAVLLGMVVAGRFLVRPVFRFVQMARSHEVSTAATLLLVIGTAELMHALGLSMALGAFIAGVLLADSEFRHDLEANVEPFKGLFLGLFFIAVGMNANFALLGEHPLLVAALVTGLLVLKFVVLYGIGRMTRLSGPASATLGITLGQGGEFAFVAFGAATTAGAVTHETEALLVVVISLSMMATPIIFFVRDGVLGRFRKRRGEAAPEWDQLHGDGHRVIIAGFGRFGQIVGRILMTRRIPFTALDADPTHVSFLRRFGNRVFYGDATRVDLLRAAGAEHAELLVIALQDQAASIATLCAAREHFPHLRIIARARNRYHAIALKRKGVDVVMRDTLLSSIEAARTTLESLGLPADDARATARRFLEYDERHLEEAVGEGDDPETLLKRARTYTADLEKILEGDVRS